MVLFHQCHRPHQPFSRRFQVVQVHAAAEAGGVEGDGVAAGGTGFVYECGDALAGYGVDG